EAKKRGWEGLLAKLRGSPYVGTRSADWLKLKVLGTDELVIAGWTPISNGAAEVGALLVAAKRGKHFVYAGKGGTGFGRPMRRRLLTLLKKDEVPSAAVDDAPRMRDAHWVTPRHVAQLQFTEWTRDGKLRHPSFQGLREDKGPQEIGEDRQGPPPSSRRSAKASGARAAGRTVSAARARTTSSEGGRKSAGRSGGRSAGSSKKKGGAASRAKGDGDPDGATGFFGSSQQEGFGTWHSNRGAEEAPAEVVETSAEAA